MCTIPSTCRHRVRTLTQRGQRKPRSAWLYFALPSEQAVNLCSAPAYLGACHPGPCPWEKGIYLSPQPSLLPRLLPPLAFLSGRMEEVTADWNISPVPFLPNPRFICRPLSLLSCCVCFLSGSRSESVLACCIGSYPLWHWPAIVRKINGTFICESTFAPLVALFHTCCVCVCVKVPAATLSPTRESQGYSGTSYVFFGDVYQFLNACLWFRHTHFRAYTHWFNNQWMCWLFLQFVINHLVDQISHSMWYLDFWFFLTKSLQ